MRIDDENKVGIYNDLLKDDFDKFEKVECE